MRLIASIFFSFIITFLSAADEKKSILAFKTDAPISVDGVLDEPNWNLCPLADQFIQLEPSPGMSPTFRTEVRFMYDDDAVYIAAKMFDDNPEKILKELFERDGRGNSDRFFVAFDTYQDGLNGFQFDVSASGVQRDAKHSFSGRDSNWDAIWESSVKIVEDGWIAEIKIPYLSLRFPVKNQQNWNVQFGREIRRLRETSYWNEIDPNQDGFLNQAGQIEGIEDIKSPQRINFTPFVTTYLNTSYDPNNGSDKFQSATAYTAGMDMKVGLNDAFTLDMTLVPDFGQTQSDNQVLNLSPFEVRFEENRQFFTEGTELFDKGGVFYSRRVGGRPINYGRADDNLADGEYVLSNPNITSLYNASKISGRTTSGMGIGFFNAIGQEENAVISDSEGNLRMVQTSPITNYNMLVIDQNMANNSYFTFLNTNVMRSGSDYDANVTGIAFERKNQRQSYAINGGANVTQRYFSDDTEIGYQWSASVEKISGQIQGTLYYSEKSDDYNPNDLGFIRSANERTLTMLASYNQANPKGPFLSYNFRIGTSYKRLYSPNVFTDYNIDLRSFFILKSRIAIGLNGRIEPIETFDYFEPRTTDFSKFYSFPTNFYINPWISSDYRRTLAIDARLGIRLYSLEGTRDVSVRFSPRLRVSDKLSFRLEMEANKSNLQVGYTSLSSLSSLPDGISDADIMFGQRDRQVFENSLSGKYIFNNKISLTLRARHYWDKVEYQRFARLDDKGMLDFIGFDGKTEAGDPVYDRNFNIFNVDMNFIWRFAPGSDVIFVWKGQISNLSDDYNKGYLGNLGSIFNEVQQNNISLKVVYWLDYNKLTS